MRKLLGFLLLMAFGILGIIAAGCGNGGSSTPVVPTTVSVFYAHSLAFRNTSTLTAFGYNGFGQLGFLPNQNANAVPQVVQGLGLPRVDGFTSGVAHSVAFMNNSTVRTWGYNAFSQLGTTTGDLTYSYTPVKVPNLNSVIAVAAGGYHTLALKNDGTVRAWGYNGSGQLGDGSTTTRTDPVAITGLAGVTRIAAGGSHSVALQEVGGVQKLYAWGDNTYGQLGVRNRVTDPDAGVVGAMTPTEIPLPAGMAGLRIVDLSAGGAVSFVLTDDGRVWGWGNNDVGQLGLDPASRRFSDVIIEVMGISSVKMISTSGSHVIVLKNDNSVWSWGLNYSGQLGNGATLSSSVPVTTPVRVRGGVADLLLLGTNVGIRAFGNHSIASDGSTVWAWGENGYGQLGNATTDNSSHATRVVFP